MHIRMDQTFDWNRMRAFLATAEAGTLSGAARALRLTQPTLGRQIAALDAQARESMDDDSALGAILEQPTLIKRPLLDTGKERFTGFSSGDYARIFNRHTL